MKVKFLKSASSQTGYPHGNQPEIAIGGRSNAGKSSLLNSIFNKKLARVSQTPGKTDLLNFYEIQNAGRLVDLPGYGWASRSMKEIEKWQSMIEEYLSIRENLVEMILVMDIRRKWTQDEELLRNFCNDVGLRFSVVLTKSDKLAKSKVTQSVKKIKKESSVEDVFAISSLKGTGVPDLRRAIVNSLSNESDFQ